MKYIIVEDTGLEQPIVFSELLKHADVADLWRRADKISAAGFCFRGDGGWHCYGESVSLNIKSRTTFDDAILNNLL